MNWKWFFSRTVRQAVQLRKQVRKILNAQRDLLAPQAVAAVQGAMEDLQRAVAAGVSRTELQAQMSQLEKTANQSLKPYPHAAWRENVEVLLVAIAVAMGIRTFFLQPFKIPTGSMQPTLYGITSIPDFSRVPPTPPRDFDIPNPISRFCLFWAKGISHTRVVARSDGTFLEATAPQRFLLFNLRQRFRVGDDWYTVWFPPDNMLGRAGLFNYRGVPNPRVFKKGEEIIRLRVISGDHLFVDRLTYNFRRPQRGDIIVFETRGIPTLPQDQFYIKRLVALGEERVRIGNDRHLLINGKRLDAGTPHFEHVYSFDPRQPPRDSHYSGHVNDAVARASGFQPLAQHFPDERREYALQPRHYMVMGDNTVNSSDSRHWGDFPRENVIGKSHFVYWPIGRQDDRPSRFGWGHR